MWKLSLDLCHWWTQNKTILCIHCAYFIWYKHLPAWTEHLYSLFVHINVKGTWINVAAQCIDMCLIAVNFFLGKWHHKCILTILFYSVEHDIACIYFTWIFVLFRLALIFCSKASLLWFLSMPNVVWKKKNNYTSLCIPRTISKHFYLTVYATEGLFHKFTDAFKWYDITINVRILSLPLNLRIVWGNQGWSLQFWC